jgi:xanthine dehydrogenase accessory factor
VRQRAQRREGAKLVTTPSNDWIDALRACVASTTPAVLVTVAAAKGSVPREPGAKMIVTADRLIGTIGGGHLEWKATEIARRLLSGDNVEALQRFPLGASLGQCCGGLAQLLFEPVTASAAWLDALEQAQRESPDEPCVVLTRARSAATADKLIVTTASSTGTLGDPALDAAAVEAARALLKDGVTTRLAEITAGESTATCLLDPLWPCDWHIVLFGAGHVGQAVVRAMAELPCRVTWVDSRDAVFPADVPANTTIVASDVPEAEVDAAPAGVYFLVMTHSHPLDQALTERILQRSKFAYFGLIGSASKRRQFERRLLERGFAPEQLAGMTCPIGVPGIDDKRPAVIAIAVAAELLQQYEARQQRAAEPATPQVWTNRGRSATR